MRFLHPDGKIMQALSRLADLVVINIMALLCCLPIITIGASLTAAYSCMFRLRENREGYLMRDFFGAFKENFRQSTILWLAALLLAALLYLDYRIFGNMGDIGQIAQILVLAVAILLLATVSYAFPMQAYFINPLKVTLRNALLMSISKLHITIMLASLNVLPFVILAAWPVAVGAYFLLGIAGFGWINSYFLLRVFADVRIE